MSYEEDGDLEAGFKMNVDEEDEPLDLPDDMDLGLDEEDPDKDS